MNAILGNFTQFYRKMQSLLRIVQENADTDLLIRFSNAALEQTLTNFESADPVITGLEAAIARVRRELVQKVNYGDFSRCLDKAEATFDSATNSYSDYSIDKLFAHVTERDIDEVTQKRIARVVQSPGAGGKIALAMANEAMKGRPRVTDATLPSAFLMAARYLFGQLYIRVPPLATNRDYLRRLAELRKLSPAALGVNPSFLDPRLLVSPLASFPPVHEYSPAVDFLTMAVFEYCPIDFCQAVQKALMAIQRVASVRSWKAQSDATKMVCAMGEHLLSLDDLFDIALVVWLLAEPGAFQPLVAQFQPYIRGLELTSDLDFAFANVTALVRHVTELDIERFVAETRKKWQQEADVEADPLNILGA
jgi:hypothetical protein